MSIEGERFVARQETCLRERDGYAEFSADKLGIREVYHREPDDDSCRDVKKKGGNRQEVNAFIIIFA